MITPDDTTGDGADTAAAPAASNNEQCVPSAALAIDSTPPAVGDDVQYTVKGKVTRIEGECTYVEPDTINDQPADMQPAAEPDAMAEAMKADSADSAAGQQ